MKWINNLNPFTKSFLGAGFALLLYGMLARVVPIYFFWEADIVGINMLLLGIIGFLRVKIRHDVAKNIPPSIR